MANQSSLNELALFAGAGGGILGGHLLGWRTVCAVEWEQYPASVLCARQNDKILSPFPILDDVQTFDGKPWRGIVDVVSGGFPCQDISAAGKGAGIEGNKSSMWKHMARIIGEVRPQYVFVENSPMLTSRGLGVVLADLSTLGFNAKWGVVSAADVGANHQRERIWIRAERNYNMVVPNVHGCVATEITASTQETIRQQQAGAGNSLNIEGTGGLSTAQSNVAYTDSERGCSRDARIKDAKDAWQPSGCATRPEWWNFEPNVG
jgi:site-specific DNA-cytosine methylase